MSRINDLWLKTIFYVYASKDDAESKGMDSATGFFFDVASDYDPGRFYRYAVTNWHVLLETPDHNPVLRINTKDGGYKTWETDRDDWIIHPDRCDLAIARFQPDDVDAYDITTFHSGFFLTDEFMRQYNVGVGDEVIMIGNFQTRGGTKRNLPTARFGNIAQMPDEPMINRRTGFDETSFIVEMRSSSGYSGSPVILTIPWISNRMIPRTEDENTGSQWHEPEPDYHKLLGIDWGHIRTKQRMADVEGNPLLDRESVWINSAMAGVVPSWKLSEMIYSKEEIEARKKGDENLKKQLEQLE